MKRPCPQKLISRMERFFSDYTEGLDTRDLRRMFDKDAVRAYAVLTRGHDDTPEPEGKVGRFFYRAKLTFLGLSYKLTPARRLLFAASLISFFIGMFGDPIKTTVRGSTGWVVDFSPFWFGLSVAMMAYLLALELVDRIRVRD